MRVVLTPCVRCEYPTVPQKLYRRFSCLREQARPMEGRGLCGTCYQAARSTGDLVDYERRYRARDELLDEWEILRGEGYNVVQAASRLGMTVEALCRALHRARADGDPRARFTYTGVNRRRREWRTVT